MTVLETPQLILRPFTDADLDDYAALMADAEVVRHLGEGLPLARSAGPLELSGGP